jgi:hypothetical protein
VILLDPGVLVIDMQRGNHPVSNYASAEAAGRGLIHATIKDQLHLTGPADIEILTDHFLEEHAAGDWPVQNLSQRELRLEDRNLVTIASFAIPGLIRMRQQP